MEHLGRRGIAGLTVPRKNAKGKKVFKCENDPAPASYERKPIAFDELDNIGHGTIETEPAKKGPLNSFRPEGERRATNVYARRPQKADLESAVEDIYGSVAPLAALSRVSIPKAPTAVRAPGPPPPHVPSVPTVPAPRPSVSDNMYEDPDAMSKDFSKPRKTIMNPAACIVTSRSLIFIRNSLPRIPGYN